VMLRLRQAPALTGALAIEAPVPALAHSGKLAGAGIALTAVVLLSVSALDVPLGLPTCLAGVATAAGVHLIERKPAGALLRGIAWSVLPLVAGLFVLVAGLARTGVIDALARQLQPLAHHAPLAAAWLAGMGIALACNLINNLPAGLIAASTLAAGPVAPPVTAGILIGVDLGPNLSVTGSLATILWLIALRREGEHVSAAQFLRLGVWVMPPALLLALAALSLQHGAG
jgi:arsenical pump membrane protein